jgi:hypothetical protein
MAIQAVAVQGVVLQTGNQGSPESFITIANIDKFTLPLKARVVDVSNVSNSWMRQIPTLLEIGNLQLDIFWVPLEVTHRNAAVAGSVSAGLRYLFVQKIKADFQIIYNDGNSSTDAFSAYVTSFNITGQTANVLRATVTLSGDNNPSLV